MRILIAPMAAMAETGGPYVRSKALALGLLWAGHEPAFCVARDVSFHAVRGIRELLAPLPSPFGLPPALGRCVPALARILGVPRHWPERSFEDVLHRVGAINGRFFASDVEAIRRAIRELQADVVYAELRPAAIVAARLEGVPAATSYRYPANPTYASSPQFAAGVRRVLHHHGLPDIESVLDIFDWADVKIVPSSPELEPLDDPKVVFTGPISAPFAARSRRAGDGGPGTHETVRNAIVVSMGNGSIGYRRQLEVLTEAFAGSPYRVYLAIHHEHSADRGIVHVARSIDFDELLPRAVACINRGGQDCVLAALTAGIPQIIFPGNVFDRRYTADSVSRFDLATVLDDSCFDPPTIRRAVEAIRADRGFEARTSDVRCRIAALGGVRRAIDALVGLAGQRDR